MMTAEKTPTRGCLPCLFRLISRPREVIASDGRLETAEL